MQIKQLGFADARLAKIVGVEESAVTKARQKHDVHPVFKRVDSCAAEIPSETPLTAENVIEIIESESKNGSVEGVVVQLGGQTPLKLCHDLQKAGIKILGTDPDAIDLAEDRERFQKLIKKLKLRQPNNALAFSKEEALKLAEEVGFPLVIRPSYVLGGQGMHSLW